MSWAALRAEAMRLRSRAIAADPALGPLPLAGLGWATVDHERAEQELSLELGAAVFSEGSGSWEPIDRDPALGAGMWRPAGANPVLAPELVVLEPDTEGRIAASLARFGEGVAVIYLGVGRVRPGRVVRGGPAWGPHVVIL